MGLCRNRHAVHAHDPDCMQSDQKDGHEQSSTDRRCAIGGLGTRDVDCHAITDEVGVRYALTHGCEGLAIGGTCRSTKRQDRVDRPTGHRHE